VTNFITDEKGINHIVSYLQIKGVIAMCSISLIRQQSNPYSLDNCDALFMGILYGRTDTDSLSGYS